MATYDFIFDGLGLRNWCGSGDDDEGMTSMAQLLAQTCLLYHSDAADEGLG